VASTPAFLRIYVGDADATYHRALEAGAEPDLFAGGNQPLDRAKHIFVVRLAKNLQTILEGHWWVLAVI
jgi:hypothetical protein